MRFQYNSLIPYCLTKEGDVILLEEADKSTTYYCPECKQELILRSGKKATHFAHKQRGKCRQGKSEKSRARHLLLYELYRWLKKKGPPPEIHSLCEDCGFMGSQAISEDICSIQVDYPIPPNQMADIALLNKAGWLLAAIKLRDQQPSKKTSSFIPWLQLSPSELLKNPYRWTPINRNLQNIPFYMCKCPKQGKLELDWSINEKK